MNNRKLVRMQEKGQVTIPQEIRKKLGLKRGDLVAVMETPDGVFITPQQVSRRKNRYPIRRVNCSGVGQQMFDIIGCQVVRLGFGSSCHNGCIFQVDNIRGFQDVCFGRVGCLRRKILSKDREGGKCCGCVLGEIPFCLCQHEIADIEGDASLQALQNQPPCRAGCRKYSGIEHTAIEKDSPVGIR